MQNFDQNFYEHIGSLLQQRNLKDFRFVASRDAIKFVASNNYSFEMDIDLCSHDEYEYNITFLSFLNEEDHKEYENCCDSDNEDLEKYKKEDHSINYDKLVDWIVSKIND